MTLLLGKPVEEVPDIAKKASPVYQVDPTDPPIFIVHGEQDIQVPVNQSLELMSVYKKNKLPVQFEPIPGAGHGGKAYDTKEVMEMMKEFLDGALKK